MPSPARPHRSPPDAVARPREARLLKGGRFEAWQPATPRYVLCDVDGTLVGASGAVHARVRSAASRAMAAGIHMGFATGRGRGGLDRLQDELALSGPHVVANGGQVLFDGTVVHTRPLAAEAVEAIRQLDVYAEYYTDAGYWSTDLRRAARPHWRLLGAEPIGCIDDADPDDLAEVAKVTVILFGDEGDAERLARLRKLPAAVGESTSPATPQLEYVNITDPDADKGSALRAAADVLGIEVAATVAVGDERNDLPMLRVAGTAVAMGQAAAEMAAAAHLVAPAVDEQGLADVLELMTRWAQEGTAPPVIV